MGVLGASRNSKGQLAWRAAGNRIVVELAAGARPTQIVVDPLDAGQEHEGPAVNGAEDVEAGDGLAPWGRKLYKSTRGEK
eukprot:SAG11_NODE_5067_length_1674_cov_1.828571_2_plen_80_part_00